jgi:hypothetical protein
MKLTSSLKKAAGMALLTVAVTAANASIFDLGVINPGTPKSLLSFGGGTQFSSFNDTFNFTLSAGTQSSGYSVEAFDFDLASLSFKTTFTNISLFDTHGTLATSDDTLVKEITSAGSKILSFGNTATSSGNYYLTVAGKIDGGGNGYFYNGSISSSVTPVPEPESYAMMLIGLGLMGAIARRRNKSDAV